MKQLHGTPAVRRLVLCQDHSSPPPPACAGAFWVSWDWTLFSLKDQGNQTSIPQWVKLLDSFPLKVVFTTGNKLGHTRRLQIFCHGPGEKGKETDSGGALPSP